MADELMFIKKSTVQATSDAIKEVKGTTDPINPLNWSTEIKSLSAGGGSAEKVILAQSTLPFSYVSDMGAYVWQNTSDNITFDPIFKLVEGETYNVLWGDTSYTCKAFRAAFGTITGVGVGNAGMLGGTVTEEPFLLGSADDTDGAMCFTTETDASHTVKITQVERDASGLVKYVTIMSWDGAEVLYEKPTIAGDNCVDPVAKGLMDKPTRESTNTQNFAHAGWSLTPGGDVDSSALANITEDRTVYAAFTASVRYYTVTYMDETSTLKTVQVTYGANASDYEPLKEGYTFAGWNPSVDSVTSDITTYATWEVDQGWLVPMASVATLPSSGVRSKGILYTSDGTRMFLADGAKTIKMYDATTTPYTLLKTVTPNSSYNITGMTLTPDETKLIVGIDYGVQYYNNKIYAYTISETSLTKTSIFNSTYTNNSSDKVGFMSFNPDGTKLAVIIGMGVEIIDTTTTPWTRAHRLTNNAYNFYGSVAVFSADGKRLYTTLCGNQYSQNFKVYDAENNFEDVSSTYIGTTTVPGASNNYTSDIVCSKDGRYVYIGCTELYGKNYSLYRYDTTTTPYTLKQITSTYANVFDLSLSHDDTMLAIALEDAPYIRVYDTGTLTVLDEPRTAPTALAYACSFNNDSTELAVGTNSSGDPSLLVYQVKK